MTPARGLGQVLWGEQDDRDDAVSLDTCSDPTVTPAA